MNLSVIVACIPFLKPFADDVQSGVLRIKNSNQDPPDTMTGHALHMMPNRVQQGSGNDLYVVLESSNALTTVTSGDGLAQGSNSRRSSFSSDKMIIKQTRAFAVYSERK